MRGTECAIFLRREGAVTWPAMYPMPPVIVRPLPVLLVSCLMALGVATTLSGCDPTAGPAGGAGNPDADTLTTLLSGVDDSAFRQAFRRLQDYDYTRYTRTEQFDGEDFMIAYREQVARVIRGPEGLGADVLDADSGGVFNFGFFRQFVSENIQGLDPVDLVPYLLGEDPPYLQARNAEKYSFTTLSDTLLWDTQARVVEVRALPVYGDGENIRRVRYFIDRTGNQLVAMSLERIDLALLFREESQFYVHMRPSGSGDLIPYNTRFQTLLRTPFRTDHQFRTVSTYYDAALRDRDASAVSDSMSN